MTLGNAARIPQVDYSARWERLGLRKKLKCRNESHSSRSEREAGRRRLSHAYSNGLVTTIAPIMVSGHPLSHVMGLRESISGGKSACRTNRKGANAP